MKRFRLILTAYVLVLAWAASAQAGVVLQVEPTTLVQGQPALVRVCGADAKEPLGVEFQGLTTPLAQGRDGCWHGLLAVDLETPPGRYPVRALAGNKQLAGAKLQVKAGKFGVRRITVDPKFLHLTPEQVARYKKEIALMKKIYRRDSPWTHWREAFALPLTSQVVSAFGRRSFVNGVERSPHGGVDLRGGVGTPVKAPAAGRAALVLDTYFGGWTLLLDHGGGLITVYMHLSKVVVKEGDEVNGGDLVAEVGATGRVTGPHLHYAVRWFGSKLDPLAFTETSRALAARLGD